MNKPVFVVSAVTETYFILVTYRQLLKKDNDDVTVAEIDGNTTTVNFIFGSHISSQKAAESGAGFDNGEGRWSLP